MAPIIIPTTDLLKGMGDEGRLMTLLLLFNKGKATMMDIRNGLQHYQQKASRNIKLLRLLGLVKVERLNGRIYYRVHPSAPDWVSNTLLGISRERSHEIGRILARLETA